MKFGMFFAGEFLHAFTIGVLTAILFFGGWRGPGAEEFPLLGVVYLMAKAGAAYFIVMWVRSTLPRIRIDHMLNFNWKFLTPLSLSLLIVTAILDKAFEGSSAHNMALLAGNIVIFLVSLLAIRQVSRRQQKERKTFKKRRVAKAPAAGKAS